MAFQADAPDLLRALAWAAALAVGLWTWARRPDAAGRAFAFWTVVWAGGVQLVLTVMSLATDAATQQVLYRAAYYATFFSTSAFVALLLYAPRRAPRANLWAAALLAPPALLCLAFAGDHGAFLAESVQGGAYAPANTPPMTFWYHVILWTGFTAGLLWLGWRAPGMPPAAQRSATWLVAGAALFAADRLARTWTWWVRDPTTLPGGLEGQVYAFYIMGAFGVAIAWAWWRARGLAGGPVTLAVLLGGAVGATSIATYNVAALGGGTTAGVVLSALLGPAYTALLARGVLAAPVEAQAVAEEGRVAVLAEA